MSFSFIKLLYNNKKSVFPLESCNLEKLTEILPENIQSEPRLFKIVCYQQGVQEFLFCVNILIKNDYSFSW